MAIGEQYRPLAYCMSHVCCFIYPEQHHCHLSHKHTHIHPERLVLPTKLEQSWHSSYQPHGPQHRLEPDARDLSTRILSHGFYKRKLWEKVFFPLDFRLKNKKPKMPVVLDLGDNQTDRINQHSGRRWEAQRDCKWCLNSWSIQFSGGGIPIVCN